MKPLIIIGSGGHAGVVIDAVKKAGMYSIVGLMDDFLPPGTMKHGCEVLGPVTEITSWTGSVFVAVGDINGRQIIVNCLERYERDYANVIHPSANLAFDLLARGIYVGPGASIGPSCEIGSFAIVNTNASLDHDSCLGPFSHLAPNSATGGRVTIGSGTFIGVGACVRDGVKIGDNCVIGMGSVVTKNVTHNSIGYGNPFKCKSDI